MVSAQVVYMYTAVEAASLQVKHPMGTRVSSQRVELPSAVGQLPRVRPAQTACMD